MLHAEEAGQGTAVVLIHAGICDSRMWDPQWWSFPRRHRTVRYDMRGFGRSPLPPEPYSHARDLVDLLERLGIERASLVGVSLGGRVALELAVSRPEVVDALVLVGAGLRDHAWSPEVEGSWAEEQAALERGDVDEAVEMNLRTWVDGPRRAPGAVDSAVRERVREMQRRAFELQLPFADRAAEELLAPDLTDHLRDVDTPTLVLAGQEDWPDIHEIAERLAREIPNARHARIADAAHIPNLERPAEFDELVLDFLARG